jgi:HEAT repeat-containing protein 5
MLIQFNDPFVKSDAIACYQHLHLFVPRFVDVSQLVLNICVSFIIKKKIFFNFFLQELFNSPNIILRKSSISCLRQLLQRESREVCEHVKPLIPSGLLIDNDSDIKRKLGRGPTSNRVFVLPESGLEGALFQMMDTETDPELREHIKVFFIFFIF